METLRTTFPFSTSAPFLWDPPKPETERPVTSLAQTVIALGGSKYWLHFWSFCTAAICVISASLPKPVVPKSKNTSGECSVNLAVLRIMSWAEEFPCMLPRFVQMVRGHIRCRYWAFRDISSTFFGALAFFLEQTPQLECLPRLQYCLLVSFSVSPWTMTAAWRLGHRLASCKTSLTYVWSMVIHGKR